MKRAYLAALLVAALAGPAAFAESPYIEPAVPIYENRYITTEILTGYFAGVGLHVSATVNHLAEGLPVQVRLGLGYAWVPCGDALRARRVFIDQNTNGSPQSRGKMWDARLDVLFPVKLFTLKNSRVFVGARHAAYTAHFEYIGGNETFDVNSNPWGLGGGLETSFALSPKVEMLITGGVDYYFRTLLSGHDTYYRPNGDDLHEKEDFTYKDADEAIAQPNLNTRLMLGVAYRF